MESKPDTIYISAMHHEEIQASHADLMVTVKGSSLLSGDEALKKAKEVSQLVDALTSFGLVSEKIQVQGVHVESSSGTFLKSSSATYRLKIRCEKLDQLADLLGIITSQKNTTLENIDWKYADDDAHERILEQAITKASAKAQKVSSALGVSILGIYSFREYDLGERESSMERGIAQRKAPAFDAPPSLDIGMDIHHSKTIKINVDIEYRVSEFV